MECWGVRERVCAVELFTQTRSITETQRVFHHEQNQQEAPISKCNASVGKTVAQRRFCHV